MCPYVTKYKMNIIFYYVIYMWISYEAVETLSDIEITNISYEHDSEVFE